MRIHKPVLLKEVIDFWINPKILDKEKIIFVDATCGEGGHSLELLKKAKKEKWLNKLKLICIDKDPEILKLAKDNLKKFKNVIFINDGFENLDKILEELKIKKIDGILFDLGASAFHFKKANRGFSFAEDNFLNMRFDAKERKEPFKKNLKRENITAFDVVNFFSEPKLRIIIQKLGEERMAKRIASFIVERRREELIKTSKELAEIIACAIPKKNWPKNIHPATKTFQALRIYVNKELENIETGIIKAIEKLGKGGRILVISFHSLEDRIIKHIFKGKSEPQKDEIYGKIIKESQLDIINKKPFLPSQAEWEANPASRSAKLRVAERR